MSAPVQAAGPWCDAKNLTPGTVYNLSSLASSPDLFIVQWKDQSYRLARWHYGSYQDATTGMVYAMDVVVRFARVNL